MTRVAITQNAQIDQALGQALKHFDLRKLVEGKLVAVKPNDTWASREDTTGITQPDTLRAVLRVIRAYEPRTLVVTGGAGAAQTDEVFRLGGLMEVVTDEGAEFFDHNRAPFMSVDLPYRPSADVTGPQKSVMVNPRVLENCGIDPTRYQGFAFGMGIERIAMLKYGIPDLRTFYESDLRWLNHYGFAPFDVPSLVTRARA